MKITLLGSESADSLESNMRDMLERLGHSVQITHFLPKIPFLPGSKVNIFLKVLIKVPTLRKMNEKRVVRLVKSMRSNLVIVFTYAANHMSDYSIRSIRNSDTKVCAWFVDAAINFNPGNFVTAHYDKVYVADLGLYKYLKDNSIPSISYLPEGHHPFRHNRPEKLFPIKEIAIVGTLYSSRVVQILKLLSKDFKFKLYGGENELARLTLGLRSGDFNPRIYYEEKARVFAESICVLNLPHASAWNSVTCRVFEVLGSGGILVTPRNEAVMQIVEDGVHAFLYSNLDELCLVLKKIELGMFDREKMVENAIIVSQQHSLDVRAKTFVDFALS